MDRDLCRQLLKRLAQLEGVTTGAPSTRASEWLKGLALPRDLFELLKLNWPHENCRLGHDTLLSVESIYSDTVTSRLLTYHFLHIGYASDGDWLAIDVSTEECRAGLIAHDENWSLFGGNSADARVPFRAKHSLEDFLTERLQTSVELWREHNEAKARMATRGPLTFMSSCSPPGDGMIVSVPIPCGYRANTASHDPHTVWLAPADSKGGMVVCLFGLEHETVADALAGRGSFHNFPVGDHLWRLAMPDPHAADLDSFMAILPLERSAVAVYASHLYWREDDIRAFLSALKLGADR